jgi:hypothetical protein
MAEQITLDPKDYSEQTLKQAIHGEIRAIKPQLAVALLAAKLGPAAEPHLVASASDENLDVRVRLAAIKELANFEGAKPLLKTLSKSTHPLISRSASEALRG